MSRAVQVAATHLMLAGAALGCTIEINEIARFFSDAENIVAGEIISADVVTYAYPEDPSFSLQVANSATMRVAQVLKGSIAGDTIDLRFEPGEPEWESTCGPYLNHCDYQVGEHYLMTLGLPSADGTFKKQGWLGQSVLRLTDSDSPTTALIEYARYVAATGERPIQLEFTGKDTVHEGDPTPVQIRVTNRLPLEVGVSVGGGPRSRIPGIHGLLELQLERRGGHTPEAQADRPDSALAISVPAGGSETLSVRLGDYFLMTPGGHGLEGYMHLGTSSEPNGPTFRDFWGNFGYEYVFVVVPRPTAVPSSTWGRLKVDQLPGSR